MRGFAKILALAIGFIAIRPCLGEITPKVYELGVDEQQINLDELKYFIEPASIPLDIEKFKAFTDWNVSKDKLSLEPWVIKDKRVVFSFDLKTSVEIVYFKYNWASPLNFQKFLVIDKNGRVFEPIVQQENMLLAHIRVPIGQYQILFIAEPTRFSTITSQIVVMNPAQMTGSAQLSTKITMLIFGIGLSFVVFNFSMFLLHRRPYFIYYVGYSLTILAILAIASGDIPQFSPILWNTYLSLNCLFTILMTGSVLRLQQFHPRLLKATLMLWLVSLLFMTSYYFFDSSVPWLTGMAFGIVCYFLCMYAAVRRMLAGYAPASLLALGWGVLALGFGLNFFALYLVNIPGLGWSAYVAFALETMLFAIALAYRTRDSEQRAIKDKVHALSQLQKVVYPHQMEQIKSGMNLESTMPTLQGQACVLSFDITDSSSIKHIKAKTFFRNVSMRCNSIMSEGYDGRNMKASAYRVKELGDGFLCSVGYPFASVSPNPANDAVDLAKRFAQVLTEESAILHGSTPVVCGIGIALDTLTGFYPEGGTKEYDIFGPAIVLAKRYEGMRLSLFANDRNRSVLIIQEVVYLSLDPSHREGFTVVDLNEHGLVVRDDASATRLYYLFL